MKRYVAIAAVFVLLGPLTSARAQDAQDPLADPEEKGRLSKISKVVVDLFDSPFHPVIKGVAPGGGLGVGIGYEREKDVRWFRSAEAVATINRYWSVNAETGFRSASSNAQVSVFGQVRDMRRLDFFGFGIDSPRSQRSAFRLREGEMGAAAWMRLPAGFRIGGQFSEYWPGIGRGGRPNMITTQDQFAPGDVPGLNADPRFSRFIGFVELSHPSQADDAAGSRGTYQLAYQIVTDEELNTFSFRRIEAEARHQIPGFGQGQRLTLHALASMVESDDSLVPFYLQYTLGGKGGLRAFRPHTLGSDGTTATLRAFQNYRFRDRNLMLLQAEYRVPVKGPVEATVFVDAGQVSSRRADLNVSDLKHGYGFSLSYMRKGNALMRVDVGTGGGEGTHVFWSFGGVLP